MTIKQGWIQLLTISSVLMLSSTSARAQITPDNTLGTEGSRLTPNVKIQGASTDRIDGGAQRGSNLFHSFSKFNVGDGQRVYFANPNGIQNILTRVTGGQASNILGTLGVDGIANLFLLNPNGILFGPNARLDVGGSFVGTTANALRIGEQGMFSATNPQAPPLLNVNPSALLFNQLNPGAIANGSQAPAGVNPNGDNTTGLRVPDGKSLLLVGGNVNLDGGRIRAYGGRIELAGLAAPGSIGLNVAGDTFNLNIPNDVPRADVSLTNEAYASVFGAGGGDIAINARNLEISSSGLYGGIGTGLGNAGTQAGDITLNATGAITIAQTGVVDNRVYTNANGNAGNINISGRSLSLDTASLYTRTEGKGNAGNIFIQAQDSVSLEYSDIFSNIEAGGIGKGGNINITARSLSVADGSQIQTLLRDADTENNLAAARGDAGNVNIDVHGAVDIAGVKDGFPSGISSLVSTEAEGNAGNINIKSGTFSLTDGAELKASTLGIGNAGSVFVQAFDSVSLENSGIYSSVDEEGVGNGGSININTGSLIVNNGAELNAEVRGQGSGGNIIINARDRVAFDGNGEESSSRAITTLQPEGKGKVGNIQVTTGTLSLTNGASFSSSTSGKGDAGDIIIDARDVITLDSDGSARSNVFETGVGKGGNIQVTTGTLSLTNGAQLSTDVAGQGDAGNITVNARDAVNLDGIVGYSISSIQSSLLTDAVGKGGNIQVTTGSLSVTNGAKLSTYTNGWGNAGNITINARDTITFDGTVNGTLEGRNIRLSSNANSTVGENVGNGGNIRVNARALFLKNGGQLNASSFGQGNVGKIIIDAQDIVAFDGADSNGLESGAQTLGFKGDGGDILVTTRRLSLTNGGHLSTFAQGNSGNIIINARDITFDGVSSNGFSSGAVSLLQSGGATGKGGDIQVVTNSLSVTNGALLIANTAGQGNGGNITIDARNSVKFDGTGSNNSSGAYSKVESTGVGDAGNIKLTTGSLSLSNGGQLAVSTYGQGNAGNIAINARDNIKLDGVGSNGFSSGILTLTGREAVGRAGDITITTPDFQVANGGIVLASTFNDSRAGDIALNAQTFTATTGGHVVTNTLGAGDAGTIRLNVSDSITLSGSAPNFANRGDRARSYIKQQEQGAFLSDVFLSQGAASGLFANTAAGSTGKGGSIIIDPRTFRIQDGARISVGSLGSGQGGSIQVQAGSLLLNRGQISAETASTNGGDITLQIEQALLLRNGSLISTTAGTERAGGNGGNITINANNGFLVAFPSENSDISANAYSGNGGNVRINAQGIFGIQDRLQLTPQSDITASSEFGGIQGQVAIIQPDVQPTQGLIELPTDVLDASSQIAQVCPRGTAKRPLGKFIVSGRDSLPPNPIEPLASTSNLSPLATLEGNSAASLPRNDRSSTSNNSLPVSPPAQIVEATGWIKTPDGKIELVAQVPEATPYAATTAAACPLNKEKNHEG